MAEEYNPVNTATTDPGKFSILGSQYDWGGPPSVTDTAGGTTTDYGSPTDWMSNIPTVDPGTLTQTPGLPDFGSMSSTDLSAYLGSPDFTSLLSGLSGLSGAAGTQSGAAGAGGGSFLDKLLGSLGGAGASGLGPYAATAGIGIYEAKQAQKDAQAKANELKGLGTPLLNQGKSLLDQYNAGTLRPDQQKLVDFTTQQGQNLIQSGSALSTIAQQAFQDYQAGKLPAADEKRLQDQVAAQKQAVRQRLQSSGITDSTILTSQDQLIDDQAMQQRQSLLDARFATGNQAYDQWLKSTEAGQQLQLQGQQFASQAFETMLNDALGFSQAGMEPVAQSIALAMQSDKDLSDSITQLLGNLASAYAYTVAGPGNAQTAGGAAGAGKAGGAGGSNLLQSIVGGISSISNLWSGIGKLFGGGPKAAGGEAATPAPQTTPAASTPVGDSTVGGYTFTPGYDFLGGAAQVGTGLQDLSNVFGDATKGMTDAQLSQYLGTTSAMDAIKNADTGISVGDVLGKAGDVAGIAAGIDKGGVSGYAQAAGSAANLAGYNVPALGYAGAVDQALKGDVPGAAISAFSTYMPIAGLAFTAASLANKAFFSDGSKDRNVAAYKAATGATAVTLPQGHYGTSYVVMPTGNGSYRLVSWQTFNDLAGSWYGAVVHPDGDAAGWQEKYQNYANNIQDATLPKGFSFDSSTGKIMYRGSVAGNYGG